jgi:O-antigen ligase
VTGHAPLDLDRLDGPMSERKSSRRAVLVPSLLWIGLWFSINTGHWVLRQAPTTLIEWIHFARTVYPFFALLVAVCLLGRSGGWRLWEQLGPVKLWFAYGVVSLLACVSSPSLLAAIYWSGVYLSVYPVLLLCLDEQDPLGSVVRLNRLNFACAAFFLLVFLIAARGSLFVGSGLETSAYGVGGRVPTVAEAAMSRSSGLARFGAVVGILAFVYLWRALGWKRLVWAVPFLLSPVFLYTLQSRGAIVGYVVSISLLLGLMSLKSRRAFLVGLVILLGTAALADRIPFEQIRVHITRGQDLEGLKTMSGRTDTWKRAYPVIYQSPLWGWGMQADRYLLRDFLDHVHNTYLYALLSAGGLGTAAFVGGLVWAWLLLLRSIRSTVLTRSPPSDPFVYEALGILTFFTVRSIPEVSGALFGVDYMLMLPVLAYLGLLDQSCVQRVRARTDDQTPAVRFHLWRGTGDYSSVRCRPADFDTSLEVTKDAL